MSKMRFRSSGTHSAAADPVPMVPEDDEVDAVDAVDDVVVGVDVAVPLFFMSFPLLVVVPRRRLAGALPPAGS